jgi:transcriptional regulator with XRE-family HTH domain
MDIRATRLARLNVLLAEHKGNKAALARTLKKAAAQVSQWCNGVRTISEDTAREIELAAKRPPGWLDTPIYNPTPILTRGSVQEHQETLVLSAAEFDLILRIRQLSKP